MSTKKYRMIPINDGFARKTGITGYYGKMIGIETVEAYENILPGSIDQCGVKMTPDIAKAVIDRFLLDCNNHLKKTSDSVKIGDVMMLKVATKGGAKAAKTDRLDKDDLRMVAVALQGKQTFDFDIQNEVEGVTIKIGSITGVTPGRAFDTFMAGENVRINGMNLTMLEGDYVEVSAMVNGEEVKGRCEILESSADSILVTPHADIATVPGGTEVSFIVHGKGGDAEESQQTISRKCKIVAYSGNPIIAYFSQEGKARNEFGVDADAIVTIKGAGFTRPNIISAKFGKLEAGGNSFAYAFNPTAITVIDANTVTCKVSAAEDPDQTDEQLSQDSAAGLIVLRAFTQMTKSNDLVAHYVPQV